MKNKIYVALVKKNTPIPMGVISYDETEENGSLKTKNVVFEYMSSYAGPSVDPVNLNYQKNGRSFSLPAILSDQGLFRVFSDFLPGPWGRRQLFKDAPETKKMNDLQLLAHLSREGRVSGAIAFFTNRFFDETPLSSLKSVDEVRIKTLKELAGLAIDFTKKELRASLVHGGARPKTTFFDEQGAVGRPGTHYIVKFNVPEDACNMARVEHCSMSLSRESGINSPGVKVVKISSNGKVIADIFLIERYDRRVNEEGEEERFLRVSGFSLCDPNKIRSQDAGDYQDLVSLVKMVSDQPEVDIEEMLRRLLFNVAINNTDDHLKNFEFIYEDGWKLAPAYDLVPNNQPYSHTTTICGIPNGSLTDDFIKMMASKFCVDVNKLIKIRDEVAASVDLDSALMRRLALGEQERNFIEKSFSLCGKRARNFGFGKVEEKAVLKNDPRKPN